MSRASSSRLEPGQHSIDRAVVSPRSDGKGYIIKWYLRLPNGKLWKEHGTQTSAQKKGLARAKARAIAEEVLAGAGNERWKGTDKVVEYLDSVTLPALQGGRLAPETSRRYIIAYKLLLGECGDDGCKHKHSLAGLNIRDAVRPRALVNCLEEIGRLHGAGNAKHARIVASKYFAAKLQLDEIIDHNPVTSLDVDLSGARRPSYSRGGRALTAKQYAACIKYLLAADPNDVEKPKRGRWKIEHRVTERAACIDILLAQATTGLRTSELCLRPVEDCYVDQDGTFIFELSPEVTKTRTGRPVPVLAPEVSKRLAKRLNHGSKWMFHNPADPEKVWAPRNRDRKLAKFYQELSRELNIPMFMDERGHSWRTTGNTLLYDVLPEATRIRLFGHTSAVNRRHYTAVTDTKTVVSAASVLYE